MSHKYAHTARNTASIPNISTHVQSVMISMSTQLSKSLINTGSSTVMQSLRRSKNNGEHIQFSTNDIPLFVCKPRRSSKLTDVVVYVPTTDTNSEFTCNLYDNGVLVIESEGRTTSVKSIDAACQYILRSIASMECPEHKASYEAIRRVDHLKAYWKLFSAQVRPHYRNIFNLSTSWDATKLQDIWRDLVLEVHECLTYSRGLPSNLIDSVKKENKIEISFIDLIRKLEQPKLF